jgi:mRNA interferase RelE/StbE
VSSYRLDIGAAAQKEIDALPDAVLPRVNDRIRSLAYQPRPAGCTKLKGYKDLWRVRAGDWRVLYIIDDQVKCVNIVRIKHRREVYEP